MKPLSERIRERKDKRVDWARDIEDDVIAFLPSANASYDMTLVEGREDFFLLCETDDCTPRIIIDNWQSVVEFAMDILAEDIRRRISQEVQDGDV